MFTTASGIVQSTLIAALMKSETFTADHGILDVLPSHLFEIVVPNCSNFSAMLLKKQWIALTNTPFSERIHQIYEPSPYILTARSGEAVSDVHYKPTPHRLKKRNKYTTVRKLDEIFRQTDRQKEVNIGEDHEQHRFEFLAVLEASGYL